jgi:hypothetical protein
MRLPKCLLFLAFILMISSSNFDTDSDATRFQNLLIQASQKSSLTSPGSTPFHLKLAAAETHPIDPQNNKAEIEIWWLLQINGAAK